MSCIITLAVLLVLAGVVAVYGDEDYYQLLGVPRDASEHQIKKAFRRQAVKYHPDKNKDPDAQKTFAKIANGNYCAVDCVRCVLCTELVKLKVYTLTIDPLHPLGCKGSMP